MPSTERSGTLPDSSSNLDSPESQPSSSRTLSDTSHPHGDQPTLSPDPRHPIGSPRPPPVAPGFNNPAKAHPAISPIPSLDSDQGPSHHNSSENDSQDVPEIEDSIHEENEKNESSSDSHNSRNDLPELQEPVLNNENIHSERISDSEVRVARNSSSPLCVFCVVFICDIIFLCAVFSYSFYFAKSGSNENHTGGQPLSPTLQPIEADDFNTTQNLTLPGFILK